MQTYDNAQFCSLPPEVSALFAAMPGNSFFALPGWYDLVACCGTEPGWRPRLYVSDDAKAALVCKERASPRRLLSFANMFSPEHDPLVGLGDSNVLQRLAQNIASQKPRVQLIRLDGLDPSKESFRALLSGFREANCAARPFFGWGVWFEPVATRSFADYLAARPSVLRNTWKRKLAAVKKSAKVSIRIVDLVHGPEQFIAEYGVVHAGSWKRAEPFPDFIPHLIRFAARCGALEAGVLEIEGMPAAAQFWIVWRGNAMIFKLAYVTERREFSPGTLLTMHMVRHVIETRAPNEINFGRGDDDYKKLWASSRRERWGIEAADLHTLRGLGSGARMAVAAGRDLLVSRPPRTAVSH